jgi:hypothetical protein
MNSKIGDRVTIAIFLGLTLMSVFALGYPNPKTISYKEINGTIIQLRVFNHIYYVWVGFFYITMGLYFIYLHASLFNLLNNSMHKLACLLGIVFFAELTMFWIIRMFHYDLVYKYVTSINFERFFGVSAFVLILLFNKLRK